MPELQPQVGENQEIFNAINQLKKLAEEAKQKKESEARVKELKQQFDSWLKEVIQKGGVKGVRSFEYDDVPEVDQKHVPIQKMITTPVSKLPRDKQEVAKALQEWNDRVLITATVLKRHPKRLNIWKEFAKGESELAKALDTTTAGEGLEFIPTVFSADFIERVELEHVVVNIHPKIIVPPKVKSIKIPGAGAAAVIYKLEEAKEDEEVKIRATTPGTRNVTVEPVKFGARTLFSSEMEEDSIVAMADFLKNELSTAFARGVENVIINGDTAATPIDNDLIASYDVRKCWDGYRKVALSAAKVDFNDTVSVANFRRLFQAMKKYGRPTDLVIITGMVGWWRMVGMSEVMTVDKYGNKATILTGELGRLFNIPIVVSDQVREDLNASGVYDGTTTDRTEYIVVFRRGFVIGDKRRVTVKTAEDIDTDQVKMVITARMDFEPRYETSTEPIVAIGYDVAITS